MVAKFGSDERFLCLDCGVSTLHNGEYYMVHNTLWNSVCGELDGMLCVGCLEKRLGRELNKTDFTDAPINWEHPHSPRLIERLVR